MVKKIKQTKSPLLKLSYALLFTIVATWAQGQNGKIKIEVKANNQPAPGVQITIPEAEASGVTNAKGKYELKGLQAGTYTIKLSRIGYDNQLQQVEVFDGKTTKQNFYLSDAEENLQEVEIIGRIKKSYKLQSSFSATKTETALRDIPQAVSYVTKEVIDDQLAFNMMDVLKNISGVSQNSFTNNKYILRGFKSESKQTLINGLKTFSGERLGDILPYVEKLEVLKGPASALFANTSPGGTINTVTKKPLDVARRTVNFTLGSYKTLRATTDLTGPLNDKHSLLYRLNMAYQNAGSFRDLQGKESYVIAPSFSYIPNEKTKINFDLVYVNQNGKADRGQPSYAPENGIADLYATPTSLTLARANDVVKALNMFSTISLSRKITDNISFNTSYLKGLYKEELREHRTGNNNAVDEDGNKIPDLIEMIYRHRLHESYTDNLTSYFVFNFNTGALRHSLLTGYDFIQYQDGLGNTTSDGKGYLAADGNSAINKYDPAKKSKYLIIDGRPVPNVPHASLSDPNYALSDYTKYFMASKQSKRGKYKTNGVYVQEQISWGSVKALLSLRKEFYTDVADYGQKTQHNVHQTALLPRFGLVYTPIKPISLYGTYVYGFQPQSESYVGDPDRYGGPFDPMVSNMIEFGAKSDWFQNKLSANLAVYRIEQNNILQNASDPGNPDMLRQIGQITGKGIELDVDGAIMTNFILTANFAMNKTEITKSEDATELGNPAANSPKYQGGFWAKYDFISSGLRGMGVALGANFQSEKLSGKDDFNLPAYTLMNGALYYTAGSVRLSAALNNIFNKTYWLGADSFTRLFPGAPRNLLFKIDYNF